MMNVFLRMDDISHVLLGKRRRPIEEGLKDAWESFMSAVSKDLLPHAGGPAYKKALCSVSSDGEKSVESGKVEVAGDDDDGDGDGDPDSDRRKLFRIRRPIHPAPAQSATSKRILRMPAVQVRIGLSRSTIYEAIKRNEFPASISLGARAVGWLESDIDAWLENRVWASKPASVPEWKPARIQVARTQSAKPPKE